MGEGDRRLGDSRQGPFPARSPGDRTSWGPGAGGGEPQRPGLAALVNTAIPPFFLALAASRPGCHTSSPL